jgi:hypothetical protein
MHLRSRYRWLGLLAMALLVSVAGCSNSPSAGVGSSDKKTDKPAKGASATPDSKPAATAQVEVKPIKLADYDKMLQQNKGKVVLVDFWYNG